MGGGRELGTISENSDITNNTHIYGKQGSMSNETGLSYSEKIIVSIFEIHTK